MSTFPESLADGQPRRMSRVWKIVAAIALAVVAAPVTLGIGSWTANQLADGNDGNPTRSTPVRN